MNTYETQFKKYSEIANRGFNDYGLLIDAVKSSIIERKNDPSSNAIIVMGFSGNGKSTWINNFLKENQDYVVISMDTIQKRLLEQNIKDPSAVVRDFGNAIEESASYGKNIIFDGNFLNLLTRMSLADTLKLFNYNVNVVNITDNIMDILPIRIMDEASKVINEKIDQSNINKYINDSRFIQVYNTVCNFYFNERKRSAFDEQIKHGVLNLGIDKLLDRSSSYDEVKSISSSSKSY